ncbi:hypothetical protein EMPG_11033 [Blastomyces silverae]|uniref:Uncharacterized protein n=1 Tax=Blastomyces silverae TaxID=2060906 RepID=A0A0H1B1Z9_9EURO|nr:hypothetical protein EMPG_11033 [Blastomyces silverae]
MGSGLNANFTPDATIKAHTHGDEPIHSSQYREVFQFPYGRHHYNNADLPQPDGSPIPWEAHNFGVEPNSMTANYGSFSTMPQLSNGMHQMSNGMPQMSNDGLIESSYPISFPINELFDHTYRRSQIPPRSWMAPSNPTSPPMAEWLNNTGNAMSSFSQTALPLYLSSDMIDLGNHATSTGEIAQAGHPHSAATDRDRSTPCRIGSRHTTSVISKAEPQPRQTGGPFVEFVFNASSGEPLTGKASRKRRRTRAEKQKTAEIRRLGGACGECRKKHRKCSPEHHQRTDRLSAQNAIRRYSTSSCSRSSRATTASTQHDKGDVVTPSDIMPIMCATKEVYKEQDVGNDNGDNPQSHQLIPPETETIFGIASEYFDTDIDGCLADY